MVFEKREKIQPDNVLWGNNEPGDDTKLSEVLFVEIDAQYRRRDFLRGMVAGAAMMIALWFGVNFYRVPSGGESERLEVLKSAVEMCVELTKFHSNFESIVDYRPANQRGQPKNVAFMVNGSVESGFDMRKARVEVFTGERRVEVTLPLGRIERTMLHLVKGSNGGVKVYDQRGELSTKAFSAKEQSEMMSSAMRVVRSRASGEWGIVSRAEENAAKVYRVMLGALSCDVRVSFTNEATKLGMPEGVSGDVMNGGGAFIVRPDRR